MEVNRMQLPTLFGSGVPSLKQQTEEILVCNAISERYGQSLTPTEAQQVAAARQKALTATNRVEFTTELAPKLIYEFCDSPFIAPADYANILSELLEIFYHFKNQTNGLMSDDELLEFMSKAFNGSCQGSLELLAHRELETLSRRLREGGDIAPPAYESEDDEFDE